MGVVQNFKNHCETAKVNSQAGSVHSEYSSQNQSEDEEDQQRPPVRFQSGTKLLNTAYSNIVTKKVGKRKARRILNNQVLETLAEEDETPEIFEPSKSKFQILMEDSEDPLELLESYEFDQESSKADTEKPEVFKKISAYFNIPRKIRSAINNRKNFQYDLLKSIELTLSSAQSSISELVYEPESCYERLLVHAVARFKGFSSETVSQSGKKVVFIKNGHGCISPSSILLCDLIKLMKI